MRPFAWAIASLVTREYYFQRARAEGLGVAYWRQPRPGYVGLYAYGGCIPLHYGGASIKPQSFEIPASNTQYTANSDQSGLVQNE